MGNSPEDFDSETAPLSPHQIIADYLDQKYPGVAVVDRRYDEGLDESIYVLGVKTAMGERSLRRIGYGDSPQSDGWDQRNTDGIALTSLIAMSKVTLRVPAPVVEGGNMEAEIGRRMALLGDLDADIAADIEAQFRRGYVNNLDPRTAIVRHLSRYLDGMGEYRIPEDNRLDRALSLLLARGDEARRALNTISQTPELGTRYGAKSAMAASESSGMPTHRDTARTALSKIDAMVV